MGVGKVRGNRAAKHGRVGRSRRYGYACHTLSQYRIAHSTIHLLSTRCRQTCRPLAQYRIWHSTIRHPLSQYRISHSAIYLNSYGADVGCAATRARGGGGGRGGGERDEDPVCVQEHSAFPHQIRGLRARNRTGPREKIGPPPEPSRRVDPRAGRALAGRGTNA
eukprot:2672492-Rhodomonas_salina.2